MATLVTLAAMTAYLEVESIDPAEEAVIRDLLNQVEALLLKQCGREHRPFGVGASRVERRVGTGRRVVYLDYPIAALTSVKLGYNITAPLETLVVNDQEKLVWDVGKAKLERVDGGVFGQPDQPGFVHVTYDTEDDIPADAALAVQRVTAAIYRTRGSESVISERVGSYSVAFSDPMAAAGSAAQDDPYWQRVVGSHRMVFA